MRIIRQARLWVYALVAVLIPLSAFQAQAQSFPDKPVHIITGVSPGGGVDFVARVLAQQLSKIWGQPVIVENRLGAGGSVAAELVVKSPPDGYTLMVTSHDITALSAMRSDLPYDLLRDLTPVSLMETAANILVVTPALPVHSVKELIALAKAEPGKITYGSPGVGSNIHLQTARFAAAANIDMVHVPYKGTASALVGVATGEVDMTFSSQAAAHALVTAGKLRMIAVSGPQRWSVLPTLPTISESGLPGFSYTTWFGVFAPAHMPKDILAALNTAVAKAVASPEMKAALAKQGGEAQSDSPAEFAAFVREDVEQLDSLVKSAGLKKQ